MSSSPVPPAVPHALVGYVDSCQGAGGLGRRLSLQPLPEEPLPRDLDLAFEVEHLPAGDTPIWVVVSCEDGHQAWSSPVTLFPEAAR